MAIDEALLQSAGQGHGSALRFYQWDEPTMSLGYFQEHQARTEHPTSSLLRVVRRATGGGAIVHHFELTYSFVTPIRDRFSTSVQDFVRQFHESLIATLADYGVDAALNGDASAESQSQPFLCFQRRSALDVLVGEVKIVGSAQRRHQGALLQHGSILLARSKHAEELLGLAEVSQIVISADELAGRWSQRLSEKIGFRLTSSSLSDSELMCADNIEQERFTNESWTLKR